MAIYRTIQMSFWTDTKVVDSFTPEDKYFYLYLMTNPHTNLCGCYEVSMKQISDETGYTKETVERLIERMEETHKVIRYSKQSKEILILNWSKYNWTTSNDFLRSLCKSINTIKDMDFKAYLEEVVDGLGTVSTPCQDGGGTSVTDTDKEDEFISLFRQIIDYLNIKANTRYKYTSEKYKKSIHARVEEGFTLNDFQEVIDKKCAEWVGTEWEKFLRPETLFGTKFESYLNQKGSKKTEQNNQQSTIAAMNKLIDELVAKGE